MTWSARARALPVAARRARAVARIRLAARAAGADLDLRIAPSARVGDVAVRFRSGRPAALHVGPHAVVDDGVEIRLDGGTVHIGDWSEVRGGVRLMVSGSFEAVGQNLLSWGVVVHCDDAVVIGRRSTVTEHVTITDSAHHHEAGTWHLDNLRTAPVRIGEDTWIGAKATVTHGVQVGDRCTVAAGAVVTRDVPDDHLAVGVPAASRRREAPVAGDQPTRDP